MSQSKLKYSHLAQITGVLAPITFCILFWVFGKANPSFDFLEDYVSKLGAAGEPNAFLWNLLGFFLVGILLAVFGYCYGATIQNRLVGFLLGGFGLGFSLISIPISMNNPEALVSKFHILAVCLGLACWMFGLAKISAISGISPQTKILSNLAAGAIVISIFGFVFGFYSMTVTHRLVFSVVFFWTFLTSLGLWSDLGQTAKSIQ
ncbi:DUF998 domain-containing protein [Algoriphagus vanfongensis]|uniref:DUF998 domain-containing protein n=1 Tax=Algoriphagus vanfongensis TaxID=426371 RepID=UPI0006872968|nr:DUF998 domain-containing protein [Algoriphagus vanfongensis]